MKYFSMFSGIGGFELGIQRATGVQPKVTELQVEPNISGDNSNSIQGAASCVGYSEIDKYAIKTYERNFNGHTNYGDATAINPKQLPDFDLLVGGFPCQAFSVAGKRLGFDDTRGTLFFDIARILAEKRPRHLVLENVKGLLSHDGGKTFQTIIGVLADLGYFVEWQVLNSKDFGVPQNRERVFIVGHLRGTPRPEVFPFGGADQEDTRNTGEDLSYTIDANYHKGTNTLEKGRRQLIHQLNNPTHSNDRVYGTEGLSPTLNTMQGGRRQPFITDPQGRKNKVCKPKPYANTLRANTHGNEQVVNHIRRLTPTECERLQGFPDNWTAGESDTQRYKMCGNAVTVNVVEAVMKKLFKENK